MHLRRLLHHAGYRYRVNYKVPGIERRTIDIAFTRLRVAVFVDGCFWHACPEHATWPKTNAEWWRRKLEANCDRDRETDRRLQDLGWAVNRVWEHEEAVRAFARVADAISARAAGDLSS